MVSITNVSNTLKNVLHIKYPILHQVKKDKTTGHFELKQQKDKTPFNATLKS